MDLETAVRAATAGDLDAFAEIVKRFQHMAFGYALSFVRDLGQAEDIVQEAFVAAWDALPMVADPAATTSPLRCSARLLMTSSPPAKSSRTLPPAKVVCSAPAAVNAAMAKSLVPPVLVLPPR